MMKSNIFVRFVLGAFALWAIGQVTGCSPSVDQGVIRRLQPNVINIPEETGKSAEDLYYAFNSNQVSANENYKGRVIRTWGYIRDITDAGSTALVVLEAGRYGSVECSVSKQFSAELGNIYAGGRVALRGICNGTSGRDPRLVNCVFADATVNEKLGLD